MPTKATSSRTLRDSAEVAHQRITGKLVAIDFVGSGCHANACGEGCAFAKAVADANDDYPAVFWTTLKLG
jgi:hypothetical protein